MIDWIERLLKFLIFGFCIYLLYVMYQPDADRLFGEIKQMQETGGLETEAQEHMEMQKLPARYDSREQGKAPLVRDQGTLGTCWAVAAVSGLEASLLPYEQWRFSADHISLQNGYSKSQNDGGAYTMAMAYLTAWKGPVRYEEDPYGDGVSPDGLLPSKHVQEIQVLREASLADIKQAVKSYGTVQTSLYMDSGSEFSSVYMNNIHDSYCYPEKTEPNHDILIIGWDDNYPASRFNYRVKKDGAFICQNSWGTDFGEEGIFYVSYEDPNIAGYCIAYSGVETADNYDSIYQTDQLGWVGQIGYGEESCYFANVYESRGEEQLEAVGFYATGENAAYEIFVVEKFHSMLSLVSFHPKKKGSFAHAGFYTVSLDEPIALTKGEKFAVIVKLTTPGEDYPVAAEYRADEYTQTADVSDGEGYISAGGYQWSRTEDSYGCNVCLKAYTSKREE